MNSIDLYDGITLHQGDCRDIMREYPDQHFDAVITDPPYGISFAGEKWDTATPHGFQAWAQSWGEEALRVIKPGGYLLAFSAPRTYHRLTSGLEDAGFEIRDAMAWIRADGKPAGMDIAASIDRGALQTRETLLRFTSWLRSTGITCKQVNQATNSFMGSHYLTQAKQPAIPTRAHWDSLLPLLEGTTIPEWVTDLVNDTHTANVLKEREGRDVRAIDTEVTATGMASRDVKNAGAHTVIDAIPPMVDVLTINGYNDWTITGGALIGGGYKPPLVIVEVSATRAKARPICEYLNERGYRAAWHVVRAYDVGAPHVRHRAYVIAARKDCEGRRVNTAYLDADRCAHPLWPTPSAYNTELDVYAYRWMRADMDDKAETSALEHWESVTGERYPYPMDIPHSRDAAFLISMAFVEWMMWLPIGYVGHPDIDLDRD